MKTNFRKYLLILSCMITTGLVFTSCGRTDFEIKTDVRNKIIYSYPHVDINVNNAVVTLAGTVESDDAKEASAKLAEEVDGVKRVNNNIEVVIPVNPNIKIDTELRAAIMVGLQEAKFNTVQVEVKDKKVTLKGKVSKADQKKVMDLMKGYKAEEVINEMEL